MQFEHLLILAIVQGLTEFLPVSSSGHLNLVHSLTAFPDQGVLIDIAIHFGSLCAVCLYFRHDVIRILGGTSDLLRRRHSAQAILAGQLALATLPVLFAGGIIFLSGLADNLRRPDVIAWATLLFAIPLYVADKFTSQKTDMETCGLRGAVIIGLAQMAALIPGASRAGVTITAARALSVSRPEAARFSMLLSIPVIVLFTLSALTEIATYSDAAAKLTDMLLAALLAALTALLSIHIFLYMTKKISLLPFVLYRIALGGGLLLLL